MMYFVHAPSPFSPSPPPASPAPPPTSASPPHPPIPPPPSPPPSIIMHLQQYKTKLQSNKLLHSYSRGRGWVPGKCFYLKISYKCEEKNNN